MQDVEMTPQNYSLPILTRDKDIYTIVGKKLFKEIHAFFQIVNLETDMDIFGLDNFKKMKTESFLKFDSISIMSNIIENDILATGESFCDVTLKLSDKVLTQKRTYTKLVEILANIGGFMQVIYSFLRIISSFSTLILYETSLVNNLFQFNIDRKIILINHKKNYNINYSSLNQKENAPIKFSSNFIPSPSEEEKINQ
jgi:hypothetical protein